MLLISLYFQTNVSMLMAVSMLREPHGMWAVIMSAHVRTLPPTNTSVMPGQYLAVYMCTLQCRIIFIQVKYQM